jgi:hypothetical protein
MLINGDCCNFILLNFECKYSQHLIPSVEIFEVNAAAEKLDETKEEFFHHVVAQLLFVCKRARPDIQTAVAFLCTRVQYPDVDDYKKLVRVIKYLRKTKDMPLRLEAESLKIAKWWVDASYAVHPDMKSHTGGVFSLGRGGIYGTSTRQRINAKSSTEAELIGVAEVLPQILWTQYFLEAQGYTCEDSIIYQDNKSAILLGNNGTASSSKRTRHINIRYYFVTNRIADGEISVTYCPTKEMIADFFTKPLQGTAFTGFRDFIMSVKQQLVPSDPNTSNVSLDHRSVLENDHDDHDPVGVLSTVRGYMSDDGFTIVRRKYRNKVSQDKTERRRINGESNGHTTKSLSKRKETAKANEGKRSKNSIMMGKAHYI